MSDQNFDTIDLLLARFAAGNLPRPAHVLVEAHLELNPANVPFVSGLESLGGVELEDARPIVLPNRDRMLASVFDSAEPHVRSGTRKGAGRMPRALFDFVGHEIDDIPWRTKMPGFREYDIGEIDGCHASMFWIKPGRTIPAHTHDGIELSLVLEGAFTDDRGHFGRGDLSLADDSVDHRPVADKGGPCIGFAVTDGSLRLTGPLGQRISDILGR